jgi:hypothetical protein
MKFLLVTEWPKSSSLRKLCLSSSVYYIFPYENKFIFNKLIITAYYKITSVRNNEALFLSLHVWVIWQPPSSECGNLSCFEGHTDTPSDHKTQENFIQYFPGGGKKVLESRKSRQYARPTISFVTSLTVNP